MGPLAIFGPFLALPFFRDGKLFRCRNFSLRGARTIASRDLARFATVHYVRRPDKQPGYFRDDLSPETPLGIGGPRRRGEAMYLATRAKRSTSRNNNSARP